MKKRFVSLCLAGLIMVAPASAVFTDISDSRVSQTAAVLDALGIMQGVGGGSFAPGKALTRAQFCKLAVTAMGVTDVSPYASYTIFPDVKHSHWAAPYINAAVRHPELKEKAIIRGYADGSFGPDKIVSYGEVCTMLLRMLGYKEEDVGPFWPADYIAQDSGGVYDHQKRCEDRREQAEKVRCCDARCRKPSGDCFGYQAERKISDRLDNVQPSLSGEDSGKGL